MKKSIKQWWFWTIVGLILALILVFIWHNIDLAQWEKDKNKYEEKISNLKEENNKIQIKLMKIIKPSSKTESKKDSESSNTTTNTNEEESNNIKDTEKSVSNTNTSSKKQETKTNTKKIENKNTSTTTNTSSRITIGEKNALSKAKTYLKVMPFSKNGLKQQLEYDGFTAKEAEYGANNCGANWNEQAAKKAKSYMSIMSFSRIGLIGQLEYDGFTNSQAEYGVKAVGY